MTTDDPARDRVERALMTLPCHEPRTVAAERLRALCHTRLAGQRRARPVREPVLTSRSRLLAGTVLATALGLIYLADILRRALSLYGF